MQGKKIKAPVFHLSSVLDKLGKHFNLQLSIMCQIVKIFYEFYSKSAARVFSLNKKLNEDCREQTADD